MRAVARGSWRCVQVLGGRSRAGPWARAGGAGVRRVQELATQAARLCVGGNQVVAGTVYGGGDDRGGKGGSSGSRGA
jgi:hypothetical protein